jgi:hypothetical protein
MSDQTTETTESTTPEVAGVQLQISDLLLAAQVIQISSQRGAIKPEEFTQIGGLYERLVKFLQSSGAIQPSGGSVTDESVAE